MKYAKIECLHETGQVKDCRVAVNNYYPLSRQEIDELLDEALSLQNPSTQQVRLTQCIPGMICPRDIEGDVAEKESEIASIFVKGFTDGYFDNGRIYEILGI